MKRAEMKIEGGISERERQVLEFLNQGKSLTFISYELGITVSSVSTIVFRLTEKAKRVGYKKMSVYVNDQGEIWRGE